MRYSVLFMIFVMLLILPGILPADAQEINPCRNDFKQFCNYVTPGGGRLVRCYEENKDKMSAECRGWAETVKLQGESLKKACDKEINASCQSEKGDPFETLDCLQSNYIDLSMDCRVQLNQFRSTYPKPVQ
jgi:hypothetical protein